MERRQVPESAWQRPHKETARHVTKLRPRRCCQRGHVVVREVTLLSERSRCCQRGHVDVGEVTLLSERSRCCQRGHVVAREVTLLSERSRLSVLTLPSATPLNARQPRKNTLLTHNACPPPPRPLLPAPSFPPPTPLRRLVYRPGSSCSNLTTVATVAAVTTRMVLSTECVKCQIMK